MDYGDTSNGHTYTAHGQHGGANGVGFMPGDNQTSPSGQRADREEASLRPVTIKQINDAVSPDGQNKSFIIDGHPTRGIVFIGQIRAAAGQSLKHVYKLDDGTGTIEVNRWLGDDAKKAFEAGTMKIMPESIYVKVHGRIQVNSGKRYVVTTFVRPVEDHNEIATHLLDATYVHLQLTRGAPKAGGNRGANDDDKMDVEPTKFGAGNSSKLQLVGPTARKVYQFIARSPQGNDGVNLYEIAPGLSLEINDVQKATEELVTEGLVYTTADDETFAVLED